MLVLCMPFLFGESPLGVGVDKKKCIAVYIIIKFENHIKNEITLFVQK